MASLFLIDGCCGRTSCARRAHPNATGHAGQGAIPRARRVVVQCRASHAPNTGNEKAQMPAFSFAQRPLAWGSLLAVLAGCSPNTNRAPSLLPLADVQFNVNVPSSIDILANDPDNDDLSFDFELDPPVATMTQAESALPRVTKTERSRAVFQWTPGIADAGPNDQMVYALTISVSDPDGAEARETLQLRVVNAGLGAASIVFVEPPGAGIAVDLNQTPCIDEMPVSVKADLVEETEIQLSLAEPAPPTANLYPPENRKEKRLSWCPTPEELDRSLSHTLVFQARRDGDDQPVVKRFLVRFKRNAGANCPGAPPTIEHTSPGQLGGPLNYEIVATIEDDVGFKAPPILAFTTDPVGGSGAVDTSGWQVVEMTASGDAQFTASIPNLNLADGETAQISYVITATDNDDPDGTRCDHSTESTVFQFEAVGGGGGGETYGDCAPCVADAQCGGEADHCVPLLGEYFCAHACAGGCGPGLVCMQIVSIDGQDGWQCLPENANCGQVCIADPYDRDASNNDLATATPVSPGRVEGLSICDADVDVFSVPVLAGQAVTARVVFENARGDLDLFMQMPGDAADDFPYQSANADLDTESVTEPCVPADGDVHLAVVPYQDARNTYALEVEVGAGDCNQMCVDDAADGTPTGNDTLDNFTPVEGVPYDAQGMVICRQDPDFYGFDARAGDVVRAQIDFRHASGDLDLQLFRSEGQAVAESLSYRDVEQIEFVVPAEDIYVLAVFGATRSVSNVYDLTIDIGDSQGCQVTLQCAPGQYCRDGSCQDAACDSPRACGAAAACAPPQACQDPSSFGGICADSCQSSFECRTEVGYACKRFEDFSTGCLPAGPGRTGDRCQSHTDCEGTDICLPLPGGYCASGGCAGDDCAPGTLCAEVPGDCNVPACLKACEGPEDCRAGYTCRPVSGGMACLP